MGDEVAGVTEAPRGRVPRRVLVVGLLVLVLVGALLLSAAIYTDSTSNDGLGLEVGTVDIATAPVTLELDASGLAPGDVVATPLLVRNDGSLQLRYSITSTVDDTALGDQLVLTIRTGVTACDPVGAAADGTVIGGPTRLGGLTADPVVGDPATGADPGDRVLPAGAAEQLCLRVELPADATESAAAGLRVTMALQFDAEQTTANP